MVCGCIAYHSTLLFCSWALQKARYGWKALNSNAHLFSIGTEQIGFLASVIHHPKPNTKRHFTFFPRRNEVREFFKMLFFFPFFFLSHTVGVNMGSFVT